MHTRLRKGLHVPLPEDPPEGLGGGGGTPTPTADITISQDRLNALVGQRVAEAERKAVQKVAEQLGMSPADAADYIKAAKEREQAQMSELERREAAAREAEQRAQAAATQAAETAHRAAVERALIAAGLPLSGDAEKDAKSLDRAARLVDAAPGSDPTAITTAVSTLKTEVPALFTTTPGTPPPPASVPGTPPRGRVEKPGEFGSDGAAEAARRFGKRETPAPV